MWTGRGRGRPDPVSASKKLAEEGGEGRLSQGQTWVSTERGCQACQEVGESPESWGLARRRECSVCHPQPLWSFRARGIRRAPPFSSDPRASCATLGPTSLELARSSHSWYMQGSLFCPLASFWFLKGEGLSLNPVPPFPRSHTFVWEAPPSR